ncbi:MAG: mechanosensitive ion channel family protein [Pseudomonadales bacterium]|nr:mechanosensitive ion channel family protein [Halieaceae bacterium]MCP5164056.1 mechanosensitive ion channel family protein [Pseudomonadales bacterium]MCP5189647.1 mechanosensitive ion channel family protein [Pseudomonadales bacterium]MCP5203869.1 mechanosensitive ion channel family protein [Pseudomonadales bacterium]
MSGFARQRPGAAVCAILAVLNLVFVVAATASPAGWEPSAGTQHFRPIRTDSPRQTLETFRYIADELDQMVADYGLESASDEGETYSRLNLLIDQAAALVDGSSLPEGSRQQITSATVIHLLDILGRIELPPRESIPGAEQGDLPSSWLVPGTPIRIVRIADGPRENEYLFSAKTHDDTSRFLRGINDLPLRTRAGISNWSEALSQITGPLIPAAFVLNMPDPLKLLWLETPIWKILLVAILYSLLFVSAYWLNRLSSRHKAPRGVAGSFARCLPPMWVLLVLWCVEPVVTYQLNVAGSFLATISIANAAIRYTACAWLFWNATQALFGHLVRPGAGGTEKANREIFLLLGKVVAVFGVVAILSTGAQVIGLPVLSIVAGLGVGGLAVALAIRPTLENLIAGIMLYLDHPVRVGDFCSFGDKLGTVENIGLRTTKIRGRDRTLITVPNAEFADMELVNWAACDMMLITSTVSLRYETSSDQLRHVLVKMREMFHAHPKIESESVRIRLVELGPSSLQINIRVYALTREWNEFFAVREDVLLRAKDIVHASGSRFALPAQTLHLTRDAAGDKDLTALAEREVENWRSSGRLPFPAPSPERLQELEGSLDWPPYGSVGRQWQELNVSEPLSRGDGDEEEKPVSDRQ